MKIIFSEYHERFLGAISWFGNFSFFFLFANCKLFFTIYQLHSFAVISCYQLMNLSATLLKLDSIILPSRAKFLILRNTAIK